MKSICSLLCALTLLTTAALAQPTADALKDLELVANVADLLPEGQSIEGTTQGFAIWGRYGFSMHDKGQCVIIDLRRNRFVNSFIIEGNTGHCNNASFGTERASKESQFPLLYVTECRGERACYVNDITLDGATLVQKIFYDGEEITGPCDWVVDAKNQRIYLYCTIGNLRWLKWFRLPRLADSDSRGEVHLTTKDALGGIPAGEIAIPQGSHICGDWVYLPDGVPTRTSTRLHITNIRSAERRAGLLFDSLGIEPEGVATRRGYLYISFHTPRKNRDNIIYRIRLNRLDSYRR
ncbi:MAG: hypothetical protein IKY82_07470 [Alistipes sp.]|nr:hypothetical protein [Alistipes sp.]